MNNELYHYKYVKREKVNGKYKYYYDWDQLKRDAKNFANDPIGKKAASNYEDAKEKYRSATGSSASRTMSDPYYGPAYNKVKYFKDRGVKYVPSQLKTPFADDKNVEFKAKSDLIREEHAKINLDRAKKAYDKTLLGRFDRFSKTLDGLGDSAKQAVLDKLGYDERNYRDAAKELYNKASATEKKAQDKSLQAEKKQQKNADRLDRLNGYYGEGLDIALNRLNAQEEKKAWKRRNSEITDDNVEELREIDKKIKSAEEKYSQALKRSEQAAEQSFDLSYNVGTAHKKEDEATKTRKKWGEEYAKAQEAYMKTPLGKLEAASDTIDEGLDYLERLFTKKRK